MDSRAAAEHVLGLAGELIGELDARGCRLATPREAKAHSGIVTFSLDGEGKTDRHLRAFLEERGVFTTARYCSGVGGLRAAVHVYTTPDDVQQLLRAVDEFRQKRA
jgi:selenocysteine lyase/cysteine desulfurase